MAMSLNRIANLRAHQRGLQQARRGLLIAGAAALLAGCVTDPLSGQPKPPSLDDVKRWLNVLGPELPVFVNELVAGGSISADLKAKIDPYLVKAQALIAQIDQMVAGVDPTTLLNNLSSLLATIMSFVPQAAPFVPLLLTLQALIAAFLAQQPVTTPNGTPIAPPSPPTAIQVAKTRAATRAMKRH